MSFSKAKRFVYKTPEDTPSPADYLICPAYEKGYSISRSARFLPPKKEDDATVICTRLSHSHTQDLRSSTPKSEKDHDEMADLDLMKSRIIEFNRSDIKRKSLREKSSKRKGKARSDGYTSSSQRRRYTTEEPIAYMDADKAPVFTAREEFIDDDYHSYTSSEELDQLKKTEEFEFNLVCRALQRIQSRKSDNSKNFEDAVLQKLDNIEFNMEHFKDNFDNLCENRLLATTDTHGDKEIAKLDYGRNYSVEKGHEMTDIITKAIQFLADQFQNHRKNILKDCQDRIYILLAEIYKSSDISGKQIDEICKKTASQLAANLKLVLRESDKPALEFTSINESNNCVMEEKCFKDGNSGEIDNEISATNSSSYSQPSKQIHEDFDKFVFEFDNFQNELSFEGQLIDALQKEITEMKRTLWKQN